MKVLKLLGERARDTQEDSTSIPTRRGADGLVDAAARQSIEEDLDVNILVEAGAGSGKTFSLVGRMVALILTGTAEMREIAAVTFTRKAAGELRERFQGGLEEAMRNSMRPAEERQRAEEALSELQEAFCGTIHSFCARLLRECPLDAGIDPRFESVSGEDEAEMRTNYWNDFLDRLVSSADPLLENLLEVGVEPSKLFDAFNRLVDNPDVEFPTETVAPPDEAALLAVRAELEAILKLAKKFMPPVRPQKGWDSLQKKVRRLLYLREVRGWGSSGPISNAQRAALFDALAILERPGKSGHDPILIRWHSTAGARMIKVKFDDFSSGDTTANRLLYRWRAFRYKLVVEFVVRAARSFAERRKREGKLTYADLLDLTARLLRNSPKTRRKLGERYRRLLVDEFQDTDPLQAEIVLLLASEPSSDEEPGRPGKGDWRGVTPRPGALFVVGDPKQSIYRFRRADIELYNEIKAHFAKVGKCLLLTTNFRSCPPIGVLVNQVFDSPEMFPAEATDCQAAFASLDTLPRDGDADRTPHHPEVFAYSVGAGAGTMESCARDDAERLASWIAAGGGGGARHASDFMILTYRKRFLKEYAQALARRGVPYRVTGSGPAAGLELRELLTLLWCMADPTDPVRVVATLTGYFFGIDYLALVKHRLEVSGGAQEPFDITREWDTERGEPSVLEALRCLHAWWRRSIAEPSDIFVSNLATELGLLPHAAASELGDQRAGGLAYALELVRSRAGEGDSSIIAACEALQATIALEDGEAQLEPGREDVVRLMNLHQAKGLEAKVVVLAEPTGRNPRSIDFHCTRAADGRALAYMSIVEWEKNSWGRWQRKPLAQPLDWSSHEARELEFQNAEWTRLLYVAATRARSVLAVSVWDQSKRWKRSTWYPLHETARVLGGKKEFERRAHSPVGEFELSPAEAVRQLGEARMAIELASRPSYLQRPVTGYDAVKTQEVDPGPRPDAAPDSRHSTDLRRGTGRGMDWGSAVHRLLEIAADWARFHAWDTADNREYLKWKAEEILSELGLADSSGDRVRELLAEVNGVLRSPLWERARSAEYVMAEARLEVPWREESGVRHIRRGSVDLAFRERDGWVLVDYKSDDHRAPDFGRMDDYRRQLGIYAQAWEAVGTEPVKERLLYFTIDGRVEAV